MRKLAVISLMLVLACAGCAAASPAIPTGESQPPPISPFPSIETPSEAVMPSPGTPTNRASPTDGVLPSLPSSTPGGWQTYNWAEPGLAIDTPPGWSVSAADRSLTLTLPGGEAIELIQMDTAGLTAEEWLAENDLPNTRCSTLQGASGVTARLCFDTISRTSSAKLVVSPPQGAPVFLSLSASRGIDAALLEGIIQSIRETG